MNPSTQNAQNGLQQVIVFPRGQCASIDRGRLETAGYVVVEADDPKAVLLPIQGGGLVTADDLTMAALEGLVAGEHSYSMVYFTRALLKHFQKQETKR